MTPEQVTIVVLNWNRRDETLACLDCLAKADLGGASIVVVDNGSGDGSVEAIRTRFPAVRVVALPENRGFTGGNNAGIRAALDGGAQGVLLLNNDTCVAADFLPPLLWALDAYPDAAAVCSAVHRMDRPEVLDVAYAEVRFDQHHAVQLRGVNSFPGHGFDTRREVEIAVGCSLLLKADALRTVGLFDEAFFAYHEDVDWCLRARKAGLRIFFEPLSRVYHRGSLSTRDSSQASQTGPQPSGEPPRQAKMSLVTSQAAMLALDVSLGTIVIRPDEKKTYILQGNDPSLLESWTEYSDDLPNAEPTPWNPISTYLGARNIVRLLRSHATREQRRAFVRSCLYELPLEFFALVFDREGWMRLGRWSYRDMIRLHFVERHPSLASRSSGAAGKLAKALALLLLVPVDLFWSLPRAVWRTYRLGRLAQYRAHIAGLLDGLMDRPIPFQRLGLRR